MESTYYDRPNEFDSTERKIVTPVEPVDDPQYLQNFNFPDRNFTQTVQESKKSASHFVGAACAGKD